MFREKHDLSNVCCVVRNLAIDSLQHAMWFGTDCHRAHHILWFERFNRTEDAGPSVLPPLHDVSTCGRGREFEFPITKSVWLLAVAGEELGEARAHVARQVLHQDGDGV